MEDFKTLPKMQCFKTGGSVQSKPKAMCYGGKMKKGGEVDAADMAQDKKIVKKAIRMHDEQEHKGEHTDLSKLKKGGRSKKAVGTVKKYKCGGGVYGAKKTDADIKSIDDAKNCKPGKANAPSGAGGPDRFADGGSVLLQPTGKPAGFVSDKKGGSVKKKKCAEGGSLKPVDAEENPGLSKLPTNVRNKMGYMKAGKKVCK